MRFQRALALLLIVSVSGPHPEPRQSQLLFYATFPEDQVYIRSPHLIYFQVSRTKLICRSYHAAAYHANLYLIKLKIVVEE